MYPHNIYSLNCFVTIKRQAEEINECDEVEKTTRALTVSRGLACARQRSDENGRKICPFTKLSKGSRAKTKPSTSSNNSTFGGQATKIAAKTRHEEWRQHGKSKPKSSIDPALPCRLRTKDLSALTMTRKLSL